MRRSVFSCALIFWVVLAISSCTDIVKPYRSSPPSINYKSQVFDRLYSLPEPEAPITVSIYKFRDQTGQYKPSDTSIQYSTAVTQGGTALLIKALQEAGHGKWFTILERENLSDILNERKLIQQTRAQFAESGANKSAALPPLPALLYAPLVIEGGVVAYESNVLTGGVGARYFGLGGNVAFRRDAVTTMLRLVSTKNSQIVLGVDAAKTIFSIQLDSGLFRYVVVDRLLSVESGISSNEPPQMAILESIEMCVYSMIMEGVANDLWSFKDKKEGSLILTKYMDMKKDPIELLRSPYEEEELKSDAAVNGEKSTQKGVENAQ